MDASGAVVPTASDVVTFSVSGPGVLVGTANGDPASLVNNQNPTRPAFHGLLLGVVAVGDEVGVVSAVCTEHSKIICFALPFRGPRPLVPNTPQHRRSELGCQRSPGFRIPSL